MAKNFILILGGIRSGKSRFAQSMAAKLRKKVLFVATAEALDAEMAFRIGEHKKARPKSWRTLEININVGQKLEGQIADADVVLLDCLTLLVSNVIIGDGKSSASVAQKRVVSEIEDLVKCIDKCEGTFIIVSNEVGLGLMPANKLGRLYCDCLGRANQLLARHASEVYFMVSGIPIAIKGEVHQECERG